MKKYDNFCKALSNLKIGAELEPPYSIVDITGIVGLFGICFELSWKLMKEKLEEDGRADAKTGSPRSIIKIAYQCGLVDDEEAWLGLLETRNILSHTYDDEEALRTIDLIKSSYIKLFDDLKAKTDVSL